MQSVVAVGGRAGYKARIGYSGRSAAWLARLLGVQEVVGSNPAGPTDGKPLGGSTFRLRPREPQNQLVQGWCRVTQNPLPRVTGRGAKSKPSGSPVFHGRFTR